MSNWADFLLVFGFTNCQIGQPVFLLVLGFAKYQIVKLSNWAKFLLVLGFAEFVQDWMRQFKWPLPPATQDAEFEIKKKCTNNRKDTATATATARTHQGHSTATATATTTATTWANQAVVHQG